METTFFSITREFAYKEFTSFENAARYNLIWFIVIINDTKRINGKYTNTSLEFELKDTNGLIFNPVLGDWSLEKITSRQVAAAFQATSAEANLVDPRGEARFITTSSTYVAAIIDLVRKLNEYSMYDNWDTADVYEENKRLKRQLDLDDER